MIAPIILTSATTGNKWNKEDTPYIPVTASEIIKDGLSSVACGATVLHIHARDHEGRQTHDPEFFVPILNAYRKYCPEVVLQMSVGGMEGKADQLLEPLLSLRPDYASFNLKGSREETEFMMNMFRKYNVRPIFEIFNPSMLQTVKEFIASNRFEGPPCFEIVFDLEDEGKSCSAYAKMLADYAENMPEDAIWSVTRGGRHHKAILALAAGMGGHLRTGLEDCIWMDYEKELVPSSSSMIQYCKEVAALLGRRLASREETRKMLGLLPSGVGLQASCEGSM